MLNRFNLDLLAGSGVWTPRDEYNEVLTAGAGWVDRCGAFHTGKKTKDEERRLTADIDDQDKQEKEKGRD